MAEIKFADDVRSKEFQGKVANLLSFLNTGEQPEMYKTVCTLINDNITLYSRVKELENGKTSTDQTE